MPLASSRIKTWLFAATWLVAGAAWAQPTVPELAAEADMIALVVVEQVDYQRTRGFPSSGSAFLRVLIPYRGIEKGTWIEVKEKGLGDEKCYYPEPDPYAFEGARFLVMLRETDKPEVYMGVAPGCRIPVLVTDINGYAVRYPVDDLEIPEELARDFTFNDPAAIVDASDFTSMQLEDLETRFRAKPVETGPFEPSTGEYTYTRGVDLSDFRRLMDLNASQ
ncbi:MAG: hypothetical protein AAGE01_11275 [Pseudomonadota bacterium]